MSQCPCCQSPLTPQTRFDIHIQTCKGCSGVAVPNNRLIPLLDGLGAELFEGVLIDKDIEGITDTGAGLSCPTCRKKMSHFGYMGTNLVHLDRCSRCSQLWITTDALAVMAALSLRTAQRRTQREALSEEYLEGMSRRFRSIMQARIVDQMLF